MCARLLVYTILHSTQRDPSFVRSQVRCEQHRQRFPHQTGTHQANAQTRYILCHNAVIIVLYLFFFEESGLSNMAKLFIVRVERDGPFPSITSKDQVRNLAKLRRPPYLYFFPYGFIVVLVLNILHQFLN